MLKYILYTVLLAIVIGLLVGGYHLYRVSSKNQKELSLYDGRTVNLTKDLGKVLVVYYSQTGHTKGIADKITALTHADQYEIKLAEPLPTGPKLHLAVKNQLKSGDYPEIVTDFPDFSQYDIIFVGAPVWWYTVATPALSFLDQADFAGKKVVPFSTQGSNPGTYFADFSQHAKNAQLLQSAEFNNVDKKHDNKVKNKVATWINALDI